jgi:hypothetical protein
VGGVDAASFVSSGSVNLAFVTPAVYTLGGDNRYSVVAEVDPINAEADQVLFNVNVMSFKAIQFTQLTGLLLDRQSGLYKQRLRVSNLHVHPIGGVRFRATLIPGAVLYNANDFESGQPAIRYDGVLAEKGSPGDSVEFTIEVLYKPLSSTNGGLGAVLPNPTYSADLIVLEPVERPDAPPNDTAPISFVKLASGDCMIEWNSIIGQRYAVEYTDDLQRWIRVIPEIVTNAAKTQWIDNGLPKTQSHPSSVRLRFYRVIKISAR